MVERTGLREPREGNMATSLYGKKLRKGDLPPGLNEFCIKEEEYVETPKDQKISISFFTRKLLDSYPCIRS